MFFQNLNTITISTIFITIIIVSSLLIKTFLQNQKFNKKNITKLRNKTVSAKLLPIKLFLLFLSFLFLIISLLRPQWGETKIKSESNGIDLVFTLDLSKSMHALDTSFQGKTTNRLTLAKQILKNFIEKNPQNRYGLIIFAGEAFVSTPLTFDHSAFLSFLENTSPHDIRKQGTNITTALKTSIDRCTQKNDSSRNKTIIISSDGGEEMNINNNDLKGFAKIIKKQEIKIITIGIGDTKDTPIPEGQNFFGRTIYKTYQGKTVFTKLNNTVLKEIANITDGKYFSVKNDNDFKKVQKYLNTLKKTLFHKKDTVQKAEKYQYFLLQSFLCFLGFIFLDLYHNRKF